MAFLSTPNIKSFDVFAGTCILVACFMGAWFGGFMGAFVGSSMADELGALPGAIVGGLIAGIVGAYAVKSSAFSWMIEDGYEELEIDEDCLLEEGHDPELAMQAAVEKMAGILFAQLTAKLEANMDTLWVEMEGLMEKKLAGLKEEAHYNDSAELQAAIDKVKRILLGIKKRDFENLNGENEELAHHLRDDLSKDNISVVEEPGQSEIFCAIPAFDDGQDATEEEGEMEVLESIV